MRAEIGEFKIDGFEFEIELDTGGNPEKPYILYVIRKDGQRFNRPGGGSYSREFADFDMSHMRNAAKKFVRDPEYREKW